MKFKFLLLIISIFFFSNLESQTMSQEAKEKIGMNLNSGFPRLNGIAYEITIKINSENEPSDITYFLNKMSKMLKEKFNYHNISSSNLNKVATFKLYSESAYSLPELKRFVTEMGYRLIEVSDHLILKK